MLRRFHDTVMTSEDGSHSSSVSNGDVGSTSLSSLVGGSQTIILACQLGAEIVVDYASCLLEVGNGIDFRPVQRQIFFLSLLLMWAATGNISISANMYLHL